MKNLNDSWNKVFQSSNHSKLTNNYEKSRLNKLTVTQICKLSTY